MLVFRILFSYFRSYTCITELMLVFRILFLYFGSYTCITELMLVFGFYSCISDLILALRSIYLSYGTYTCITEHILVLLILYLCYGYGSTHRYYRDFTCTKVPVGTTEQIQRYP